MVCSQQPEAEAEPPLWPPADALLGCEGCPPLQQGGTTHTELHTCHFASAFLGCRPPALLWRGGSAHGSSHPNGHCAASGTGAARVARPAPLASAPAAASTPAGCSSEEAKHQVWWRGGCSPSSHSRARGAERKTSA